MIKPVKQSLYVAVLILIVACGSKNNEKGMSSELFGWKKEDGEKLYKSCRENFNLTVHPPIDTAIYCDCFVRKIVHSIHKSKFEKPDAKVIKLESDFSDACIELTRKTMKEKQQ